LNKKVFVLKLEGGSLEVDPKEQEGRIPPGNNFNGLEGASPGFSVVVRSSPDPATGS
jgi:hypothetical protein